MKLQDLHILMTVVQAGSMKKAAALLNTSQPAISRSIADLEQSVGASSRSWPSRCRADGLRPHPSQARRRGFRAVEGGRQEHRVSRRSCGWRSANRQHRFLATSFVSAVVDRLSRRHPRIVFHFVTGTAEILQRDLHERKVDLLITRSFGPIADERLHSEFLFDDSFSVAAGAQNRWTRRRRVELADLVNEPWVLPPPESAIWSVAMESFRMRGLTFPRVTAVAVLPEIRISLLATERFLDFSDLGIKVSRQTIRDQGLADRTAGVPRANRTRYSKEPDAQPRHSTFL